MKFISYIIAFILFFCSSYAFSSSSGEGVAEQSEEIDIKHVIFGHIEDAYEWHITNWGEKEIAISLPVIVYAKEKGWNIFLSSKVHHGHEYNGFYISHTEPYEGKVVFLSNEGVEKRPFDISITKNAFAIMISSMLLIVLVLSISRWYKHRNCQAKAPKGFVGLMEMMIMMIHDDIIKTCVGKDYKKFAPYLLTAFFFIFFNNLLGIVPIFPGGANVTGNIAVTFALALCTFIAVNLFGTKEYWKEIFWPHVPLFLKAPVPIMQAIEFFGIFTKPFALTVRLFANITAGHIIILSLTAIIFITARIGVGIGSGMTIVSILFTIFMNFLELLVAFIQAYVFTMLSAVFIGMGRVEAEESHKVEGKKC